MNVTVTRDGGVVGAFVVTFCRKRVRARGQVAPGLVKGQVGKFLVFANTAAPVAVGDLVTFPGGSLALIYEVRNYTYSLQTDLQMLAGETYQVWEPATASQSINPTTLNLRDVVYSPASPASIFAYLDPMSTPDSTLMLGKADERGVNAYTISPIAGDVVLAGFGEFWIAHRTGDFWPVIGIYRTPMRRLLVAPDGVSS